MGDSITRGAFKANKHRKPDYTEWVEKYYGVKNVSYTNGGKNGAEAIKEQHELDGLLARFTTATHWTLAFGTNDVARNRVPPERFKHAMKTMAQKIIAAGKTPIIPTIPYTADPRFADIPVYNQLIQEINEELSLRPGPDLYSWFKEHPEELSPDGVHPSNKGDVSVMRLWAEALAFVYRQ